MSKSYRVIHDFKDLRDKNKIYRAGDAYPNPANKKVSAERLKQLSTKENKLGVQLIQEVKDDSK